MTDRANKPEWIKWAAVEISHQLNQDDYVSLDAREYEESWISAIIAEAHAAHCKEGQDVGISDEGPQVVRTGGTNSNSPVHSNGGRNVDLSVSAAVSGGHDDRPRDFRADKVHASSDSDRDSRSAGGDRDTACSEDTMTALELYKVWVQEHADDLRGDWPLRFADYCLSAANTRIAELERALEKYGAHRFHCPVIAGAVACSCGLDAAKEASVALSYTRPNKAEGK